MGLQLQKSEHHYYRKILPDQILSVGLDKKKHIQILQKKPIKFWLWNPCIWADLILSIQKNICLNGTSCFWLNWCLSCGRDWFDLHFSYKLFNFCIWTISINQNMTIHLYWLTELINIYIHTFPNIIIHFVFFSKVYKSIYTMYIDAYIYRRMNIKDRFGAKMSVLKHMY